MNDGQPTDRARWLLPAGVFAFVLVAQLWLVAVAGNDIPYYDQWEAEGRGLYPALRDGTLRAGDLFAPHNEHRIFWTRLLDLGLFAVNGRWDPLVQQAAGAVMHALVAAVVAGFLAGAATGARRWLAAGAAVLAFLPVAAWHNALWGFQSQVYFSILFAVPALAWLPRPERRGRGLLCALAAMVAMGPGLLVPFAALGVWLMRDDGTSWFKGGRGRELGFLAGLAGLVLCDRIWGAPVSALGAASLGEFAVAWVRLLAWPHAEQPLAALILNLPLGFVLGGRILGRRKMEPGEDLAVALGLWVVVVAGAMAWARGGGDELEAGVPSRYVDFLVLLPLANAWCLLGLMGRVPAPRSRVF